MNTTPQVLDLDIARRLPLTARRLHEMGVAVFGAKGTGKSNSLAVLIEELGAIMPFVIVDPHGEYYTLGQQFEDVLVIGKSDHVHLQATVEHAGALAAWAYEAGRSVILDLLYMEEEEREDFVLAFFNAFWARALRSRKPYLVVVDEAHNFVPERGNPTIKGMMRKLALEGRKFGITLIMATQTPTEFSKTVLKQLGLRFFHAVYDSSDMDALTPRIPRQPGQKVADVEAELLNLGVGEALVINGGEVTRVQMRRRHTQHVADTPEAGGDGGTPQLAPVNAELIKELRAALGGGAAEPSSPFASAAAVEELDRLRLALHDAQNKPARVEYRDRPVITETDLEWLKGIRRTSAHATEIVDKMLAKAGVAMVIPGAPTKPQTAPETPLQAAHSTNGGEAPLNGAGEASGAGSAGGLPLPDPDLELIEQVVGATARGLVETFIRSGYSQLTRTELAAFAGKQYGGRYVSDLKALREYGAFGEPEKGVLELLGEWSAQRASFSPLTLVEVFDLWARKLEQRQTEILHLLINAYPEPIPFETLADGYGIQYGGRFISTLKGLEDCGVAVRGNKNITAAEWWAKLAQKEEA